MAKLTDKEILKAHRKREAAASKKKAATRRNAAKAIAGKYNNRTAYKMSVYGGHGMNKIPRASMDSKATTARKTISEYRYQKVKHSLGFQDTKPTISSSYKKVITKQYPKYTGPKAPYVNPRGGGRKGLSVRVQGRPMKAAGSFSQIPEGYLGNKINQKAIAARTAKVAKGVATAGRIARGANIAALGYEAASAIYKGYKRATGPGGREFHSQFVDYTSNPKNRGKRGVNY